MKSFSTPWHFPFLQHLAETHNEFGKRKALSFKMILGIQNIICIDAPLSELLLNNNGVLLTCFPTETQLLAPPSSENERKKRKKQSQLVRVSMCRGLQSGLQFCKHSFLYSLISNNILFLACYCQH